MEIKDFDFLFALLLSFSFSIKQMQLDEVTEAWGIKVERVEMLVLPLIEFSTYIF